MSKMERQLNLLAYLLESIQPVTLEKLKETVYKESDAEGESLRRMFERDKEELREMGVPVTSVKDEFSGEISYTVRQEDYYLPGLELLPDEIVGLNLFCGLLAGSGMVFGSQAHSALLKLGFDFEEDVESEVPRILGAGSSYDDELMKPVVEALKKRKCIGFKYRSLDASEAQERNVEPYGLFNRRGAWYIVGRCLMRDGMRSFKTSRIEPPVTVNRSSPHKPDFEVPADFDINREATWEWPLSGRRREVVARVRFMPPFAYSNTGGGAGVIESVANGDGSVDVGYRVEDPVEFVSWVLEFGKSAKVLSPEELVQMVKKQLNGILKADELNEG